MKKGLLAIFVVLIMVGTVGGNDGIPKNNNILPPGFVAGYVKDASNNNPIVGASVDSENGRHTTTDSEGYYRMSLGNGVVCCNITYSADGYEDAIIYTCACCGETTWVNVSLIPKNNPPNTPLPPWGQTSGYTGRTYEYSSVTADPEGDMVYYLFDWGDGSNSGWIGPKPSSITVTASHSWKEINPPSVTTKDATNIGATSARLNGKIDNDGGETCQIRFRYREKGTSNWIYIS